MEPATRGHSEEGLVDGEQGRISHGESHGGHEVEGRGVEPEDEEQRAGHASLPDPIRGWLPPEEDNRAHDAGDCQRKGHHYPPGRGPPPEKEEKRAANEGEQGETRTVAQHNRHFVNLFENPVLFYAACITAMVTSLATETTVWLAWAYVVIRVVHTFIHLGSNKIYPRMATYGVSWVVLLALWATLVMGVAGGQ